MSVFRDPYGVFISILVVVLGLASCRSVHALSPAVATVPQSTSTRIVITDVAVEPLPGAVRVAVRASHDLPQPTIAPTDSPRFVVDMPGVSRGTVPQEIPGDSHLIQRIEVQELPEQNVLRFVVHLTQSATPSVELQQRQLWLTLAPPDSAAPQQNQSGMAPVAPAVQTTSPTPETSSQTTVVEVAFEAQTQPPAIVVHTTGPAPQVLVKKLKNPARLLLHLQQAHLNTPQQNVQEIQDPYGVVTAIHASAVVDEGTPGVHIVAHMRTPAPFEVKQEGDTIRLVMAPTAATRRPQPLAARKPVSMQNMAFLPSPAMMLPALSPMVTEVSPPPPGIVAQVTPIAPTTGAPRVAGSASGAGAARSVAPTPRGTASGNSGTITVKDTQVYAGQKISLDFQDADINDILRLIAEVSGFNIIAGGDVKGKVTTRMVDVPWDQALDIVLKINGLGQEREGNIIRVAPLERFNAERKARLDSVKIEGEAEPTVSRVIPINYAPAADLKTNLEKRLSNRGTIFIDSRTNNLIITDTQKNLDDMLALINTLDRPTPQVMIEGRIVESSRDFLQELGVQIGLVQSSATDRTFPNTIDVRGGLTPSAPAPGGLALPPSPANFLLDLPAAVARGSGGALGFSLASIGGSILDLQLSALERSGRGKIVSSPKIATLDNTEAQIQSGQRLPYETTSAEGTKTEFVDASISLKVTPHVTPNDFIGMKIIATKNEPDFSRTSRGGAPTITTREATTEMLVRDGDTVVIGGLYQRTITNQRDAIPFLSKVPILGWLFQKTAERDETKELLIFITPRIIRQQEEATGKRRGLSY